MSVTIKRHAQMTCASCGSTQRVTYRRQLGQPESDEVADDCPGCGPTTWISLPVIPTEQIVLEYEAETNPPVPHPPWLRDPRRGHQGCESCENSYEVTATGMCSCECHRRVTV